MTNCQTFGPTDELTDGPTDKAAHNRVALQATEKWKTYAKTEKALRGIRSLELHLFVGRVEMRLDSPVPH